MMPHDTPLISTLAVGLGLAFVFGYIAVRLRLSPLVGYLLAGWRQRRRSRHGGGVQSADRAGAVDILVNNVGIFEPKPFAEITNADWLRFFETNV